MKEKDPGAWLTLNTSYYPAIVGNPLTFLDDAYVLIERAHGVAIHSRNVSGRLRAQRYEIAGEHAAARLEEGRSLRRQRRHIRQHQRQSVGD